MISLTTGQTGGTPLDDIKKVYHGTLQELNLCPDVVNLFIDIIKKEKVLIRKIMVNVCVNIQKGENDN